MSWIWINVLSLDAPIVAVVWQDFFARLLDVRLGTAPRLVLALAVWLAYAADRWLDAWKLPQGQTASPRHEFARRHRSALGAFWLIVLGIALALAWQGLSPAAFRAGWILLLLVVAYYTLNHWPRKIRRLRWLKEATVAVLFALGTTLFVYVPLPALSAGLLLPVVFWALLCFLNCYAIACWEFTRDRRQDQESLVTRWPALKSWFQPLTVAVAAFSLLLLNWVPVHPLAAVYAAVALSCLALAVLDRYTRRLKLDHRRVLADLVLLTPLLHFLLPANSL
jgi:hypothetical protein